MRGSTGRLFGYYEQSALLATLMIFTLYYYKSHCFGVECCFATHICEWWQEASRAMLTATTSYVSKVDIQYCIFAHSFPWYGRSPIPIHWCFGLSGHILLTRCWSFSYRRPSSRWVFSMAPLLTMVRLYVPQHTPVNICRRQLCLSLSGSSFCVVHTSGTIEISLTHSYRLARLLSCALWSAWRVSWSLIVGIHLRHVHKLAAHLTKILSMQRFGEYVGPHLSCMTVFHWHVSMLDTLRVNGKLLGKKIQTPTMGSNKILITSTNTPSHYSRLQHYS